MGASFHRAPAHLQKQALLRIHALCFSAADAKEGRIKLIKVLHQARPAHVLVQWPARVWIVVTL